MGAVVLGNIPFGIVLLMLLGCLPRPSSLPLDREPPASHVVDGIYQAADPQAPVVRLENLYASERFWPHQIQLTEDWKPAGWEGDFGWGMGVLLRVREDGQLRVDFSRFGKHWIPAQVTDVVARANAVRLGGAHKYGPNLLIALKNRLLDPTGDTLREISQDLMQRRLFVILFADPRSEGFADIARGLAPLADEPDAQLLLIAQGGHRDAHVYKACHDAGWRGAFLLDRFAPAYTEGLLDEEVRSSSDQLLAQPFVQLATPEGRVVWESTWTAVTPAIVRERLRR